MHQAVLRVFGFFGAVIFLPLFLFTFSDPHSIERAGQSFIEWKLSTETENKVNAIQIPTSNKLGAFLNNKVGKQLDDLKQQLHDDLPAILASQITQMKNLSCECRKNWEQRIANSINLKISTLQAAKNKIADFSQAKYMQIVEKLTADVRIFLGVNSAVFIIFLLVSFLKPRAIKHLFLPGVLLLLSTVVCSYFYLFEQNWFYTILYNDYTGFVYLSYLGLVFMVLSDIVFNKGRVTTEVLNMFLSAIGRMAVLVPC